MMNTTVVTETKRPFFKRLWVKVVAILLGVLFLLLIGAVAFGYWFATKPLPNLEGEKQLTQLNDEVSVIRDERGVAQINATNLEDLFFVQGYVTAQDRLFQMDMTRRLAGGRLSEVVGQAALDTDIFFRTYGMHRAAPELVELFDDETATMVNTFADGVNTYMEEAFEAGNQPLEFRILGYEPEPWTPEDSALVVKYMGYTLSGNFRSELDHYLMVKKFGEDAEHIIPDYHVDDRFPTIYEETAEAKSPFSKEELHALATFAPPEFNGSNNWAISGEYTESGYPLVADDPHLGLAIPSVWYQTHLNLEGDFHSMGVTVPGVPGVVLGSNEQLAWGVTSMSVDQEDLFLEQRHSEKPHHYLYDGEWEEAEIIEEVIEISDGETHVELVEVTRNGPIINQIIDEDFEMGETIGDSPYQAMSLRWTGREAGEELNGVLKLNRAQNADEFLAGLDNFVTPALSWVFADRDGNIGYRGQARLPVREKSNGMLPVPGWDPDYQWQGFIEPEELPQLMNPEQGYIMTANNKPVDDDYAYEIGRSFHPYRAERLDELIQTQIAAGELFTVEDMKEMQVDFLNTQARSLLPVLLEVIGEQGGTLTALEKEVYEMMASWDYVEAPESGAAFVWNLWKDDLGPELFEEVLGFEYRNQLAVHKALIDAHEHTEKILFGDLSEEYHRELSEFARMTFANVVTRAENIQGANAANWEWGKWHKMTVEHPLASVWPLNHLFNVGTWELGGSSNTPGANGYNRESGNVNHGAGWRFVADLSSTEEMYDIVIPGQSGQLFSPFYADQVDTWVEGNLYPMIYNKQTAEDMKTKTFTP
ncbi:penicillin acylase family protein [Bacillus shivajii]|uniref:penicillin acylase family protein n=1 Tax=Bacillus shivajii TaxID=1983719 RepID=UPI001CF9ED15|nr:penicillin acylase family protein [Bacillus shivajii]UCZ52988.1 penicillin acylase family protein [Bacillus shivajii]